MTVLAGVVLRLLAERGETLGCAESLTAGLVAAAIADIPGSSAVLRGGVVSYATDLKVAVLGVPDELIERHGVVSGPCATAMAEGALRLLGTDWAVSTTGVAGPDVVDGVQPGTVCVGVAGRGQTSRSRELRLSGSRNQVRAQSVDEAFTLLLEALGVRSTSIGDDERPAPAAGSGPIRVKAYAVLLDESQTRHAVWRGIDATKEPPEFHRLLGGRVEFGERTRAAVVREIAEELGATLTEPRLLGVLEDVFEYQGGIGHDVAFVFAGNVEGIGGLIPDGGRLYRDDDLPNWVEWRRLDGDGEALPLYPNGLQALLSG